MWIDSLCIYADCQQHIRGEGPDVGGEFSCPRCRRMLVILPPSPPPAPPPPKPGISGEDVFLALLIGVGTIATGMLVYKAGLVLGDTWEGAGPDSAEFSANFKIRFKNQHVARNGLVCPRCTRRVRSYAQLHVDHKRTVRDGGEPYASNAQILCDWCNLAKGGNSSFLEYAFGR